MADLEFPHRRYNPLTGEWVLVSPHRAKRPWLGQMERPAQPVQVKYDPSCTLCPGNKRVNGMQNPDYATTFVFDNDFPAILPPGSEGTQDLPESAAGLERLYQVEAVSGICRVVCFSPRHDLDLPKMPREGVEAVLRTWSEQTAELGAVPEIAYVQVFENKGEMMGCSNPHPHSQIWSSSRVPNEPAKEMVNLGAYQKAHGSCLLCDYVAEEARSGERVVAANEHFLAVVPFWAVWPFEVMVVSRRHLGALTDLGPAEIGGLAQVMQQVAVRFDNLFETSFPYSMGFHQSPTDGQPHGECHLHAHFYPPLLRSATVRKFMVGYELLAMPQRDLTPETAAARLREQSEQHYLSR
jgi:UDPglucose--hexose-1-phosphate uridylyltransferase